MNWLTQSLQFLVHEKRYTFLLLIIIAFLSTAHFSNVKKISHPDESLKIHLKEVETTIQQNSRNPEFLKKRFQKRPELQWSLNIFTIGAIVSVAIGILMNIGLLQKWRKKQPWLAPRVFGPAVKWGFAEIAKVIILVVFIGISTNLVFFLLHKYGGFDISSNFLLVVHTTVIDLTALFLMIRFVKKKEGVSRVVFGFRAPDGWFHEIFMGVKAYFVIIPYFLLTLILLLLFITHWAYEPPPHPLIGVFVEEGKRAYWIVAYSLILACVVAPVIEEVFFRGFLYPVIRKHLGIHWAMAVTAILFAMIHESLFALFPIFLLGLALAYLYEKRGNLAACIALHMLHNTVFITYFFLIKEAFLN